MFEVLVLEWWDVVVGLVGCVLCFDVFEGGVECF